MNLEIKRHSLEHVMVLAVRRLFGQNVELGVGPVIENGFYQDFGLAIAPDAFPEIEAEMYRIIQEGLPFSCEMVSIPDAISFFEAEGQKLKVELLRDIEAHGTSRFDRAAGSEALSVAVRNQQGVVSLYSIGEHKDLCRGPHVEHAGNLRGMAFKLDRVAGAYWRGNEKNKMLCRIYGLAFESKQELAALLSMREEARKRDHRKLGEELELFFFHESAPGMPYWLPKGLRLKNLLISYWRQYHDRRGYQEISAPLLNKRELWDVSGHWQHYQSDMMKCELGKGEEWALKPMNCANAMLVWKHKQRSYRDLPLRLSDTDILHRNERAGSLSGLLRARCFCQDDSHNFVSEEQIAGEIEKIIEIVRDFYGVFSLEKNVQLYLATRPDDFMGDLESWDRAEAELSKILAGSGFRYGIKAKDGAFYGPKIDIHLKDALGREWQCGTIQLDFQLPRNFGLVYADRDGSQRTPVVIHRVIYGSIERFIAIVLEHFAGRLPFWVAPVQVRVLPVNRSVSGYLERVKEVLANVLLSEPVKYNELRFEIDDREESLSRRIRDAEIQKIPVLIVIGNKEADEGTVNLRRREDGNVISEQVALLDLSDKLSRL
jgi:threonyl-tRNA synthetase